MYIPSDSITEIHKIEIKGEYKSQLIKQKGFKYLMCPPK